ncbi:MULTISPECIES: hypothetical protein [Microbacterium]|uniref:hypothetical protein n=1 Tax=Microbacterium TaxID=33882 RepID=UPI0013A57E01|nr:MULTISPECIES: hypothetical protein [Microbacterium]
MAALIALSGCAAAAEPRVEPTTAADIPPYPAQERYVQCLQDEGWEIQRSLTSPPYIDGLSEAQQSAFNAASDACGEETGYKKSQTPSMWSTEQVRQLYAQELANHECIVGHGFPSDDPPSEAVFLDTFGQENAPWYQAISAYLMGGNIDQSDYSQLLRDCPPPLMFMNIDGF